MFATLSREPRDTQKTNNTNWKELLTYDPMFMVLTQQLSSAWPLTVKEEVVEEVREELGEAVEPWEK